MAKSFREGAPFAKGKSIGTAARPGIAKIIKQIFIHTLLLLLFLRNHLKITKKFPW